MADGESPTSADSVSPDRWVRVIVVVAVVVLVLFALLATAYDRFPGDVGVSQWVQDWRASWLDTAMEVVAVSGDRVVAAVVALVAGVALWIARRRIDAAFLIAAIAAGFVARTLVKALVGRPRPPEELVEIIRQGDGFSFPSGHALHYTVFLGFLFLVFTSIMPAGPGRLAVRLALIATLVVVGLSRIYLGAHWLSDVIGGYAFGGAVLAATAWIRWRLTRTAT